MPSSLGKELSLEFLEKLDFVPFLFALGAVIFDSILFHESRGLNIVALIIASINLLSPNLYFNRTLFPENHADDTQTHYELQKARFLTVLPTCLVFIQFRTMS